MHTHTDAFGSHSDGSGRSDLGFVSLALDAFAAASAARRPASSLSSTASSSQSKAACGGGGEGDGEAGTTGMVAPTPSIVP